MEHAWQMELFTLWMYFMVPQSPSALSKHWSRLLHCIFYWFLDVGLALSSFWLIGWTLFIGLWHIGNQQFDNSSLIWQFCCLCVLYSTDELNLLLSDDDKLQAMLSSRIDEVNDVQQKVVLFLEKFARESSLLICNLEMEGGQVND